MQAYIRLVPPINFELYFPLSPRFPQTPADAAVMDISKFEFEEVPTPDWAWHSHFRFMDLPAEVRCLIYEVAARKEDGVGVEDFRCYIKDVVTARLPPILRTSRPIRIEAFQSFVQSNVILLFDFERSERLARSRPTGSGTICVDDIQKYIQENSLDFNFLLSIRAARLHVDRRDRATRFIGLSMLERCTNVRNLILDLATTAKINIFNGQWFVDKTIPSALLVNGICEVEINAVRDLGLASLVTDTDHKFDHEWAQLLCAKLIEMRCVGLVRMSTVWDSKRKYQDESWDAT